MPITAPIAESACVSAVHALCDARRGQDRWGSRRARHLGFDALFIQHGYTCLTTSSIDAYARRYACDKQPMIVLATGGDAEGQ